MGNDCRRSAPKTLFSSEEAHVLFNLGVTNLTNELFLPMIDFILDCYPIDILIQKEESPSANVYLNAGPFHFLIKGAYGIGYQGEGSRGLEKMLTT